MDFTFYKRNCAVGPSSAIIMITGMPFAHYNKNRPTCHRCRHNAGSLGGGMIRYGNRLYYIKSNICMLNFCAKLVLQSGITHEIFLTLKMEMVVYQPQQCIRGYHSYMEEW